MADRIRLRLRAMLGYKVDIIAVLITLSGMMNFFKEDLNTIAKGELKYKADFVLDLRNSEYATKAKIRASMKDKCYNVVLTVDGKGEILNGKCQCP